MASRNCFFWNKWDSPIDSNNCIRGYASLLRSSYKALITDGYLSAARLALFCGLLLASSASAYGQQQVAGVNRDTKVVETESIRIDDIGATPNVITRPLGSFFLRVANQRLGIDLDLQLIAAAQPLLPTTETGTALGKSGRRSKNVSVGLVTLPIGTYYLQDKATQATLCTIVIKGNL